MTTDIRISDDLGSPGNYAGLGARMSVTMSGKHGNAGAVVVQYPVLAAALDLVDTNDREMRDIGALDVAEFGLELFFGGIDQQLRMLAEDDFADLDKAPHVRLADFMRIQFINLVVVVKLDAKGGFRGFSH